MRPSLAGLFAILATVAVGLTGVAWAQQQRWAAIDPNREVSSGVVWGSTEAQAKERAVGSLREGVEDLRQRPGHHQRHGRRVRGDVLLAAEARLCRRRRRLARGCVHERAQEPDGRGVSAAAPCGTICQPAAARSSKLSRAIDRGILRQESRELSQDTSDGSGRWNRLARRRDGCRHHRRGSGRAVRRVRAGPGRHQGARHRHPGQARRPVRRALSGKADLRHSRPADRDRPGPDRRPAGADQAVQRHLPSGPAGRCPAAHGRRPLSPGHRRRHAVRGQGGGDRGRRRLVHAQAPAARRHRSLRRQVRVLFRAAHGGFPRQGRDGGGRRRQRARLDAQPAADRPLADPGAPARRLPRCPALGRADARAGGGQQDRPGDRPDERPRRRSGRAGGRGPQDQGRRGALSLQPAAALLRADHEARVRWPTGASISTRT